MHCFGLGRRRSSQRVILRVCLPTSDGLLTQHVDGDAVLGMNHDRGSNLGGLLHGAKNLTVVRIQHAGISHEQLEAGDAVGDDRVHLLEGFVVDVADDHVKAVVDGAVALSLVHPFLVAVHDALTLHLDGEVDEGGGTAVGRGPGSRLEAVRNEGSTERQLEMGMNVDGPRDDVFAGGVDHTIRPGFPVARARGGDGDDLVAVDEHVGRHRLGGGYDSASLDDGPSHVVTPPWQSVRNRAPHGVAHYLEPFAGLF